MSDSSDKINVVVAADFSAEIIARIRAVSSQLNVLHHFPDVPASVWNTTEILYTIRHFPEPEDVPLLRWIQVHYAGMESVLRHRIVQAEDVIVTSASGIHATTDCELLPDDDAGLQLSFADNVQFPA